MGARRLLHQQGQDRLRARRRRPTPADAAGQGRAGQFSFLQVLAKDPTSVKALFRRGVAYSRLNNLDKAHADLLAAAKANPNGRPGGSLRLPAGTVLTAHAPGAAARAPADALIRSEYEDVKKRQQAAEAKARSEMAGFMSRAK